MSAFIISQTLVSGHCAIEYAAVCSRCFASWCLHQSLGPRQKLGPQFHRGCVGKGIRCEI